MAEQCKYEQPQEIDKPTNTCGLDLVTLAKVVRDSVVRTESPEGGIGSGFIVSHGKDYLIVTDDHNLDEGSPFLRIARKGERYTSTAIARNASKDIAIMRLEQPLANVPKINLLPSEVIPSPGDGVLAVGFPGGVKKPQLSPGLMRGQDPFYTEMTVINATQPCNFGSSGSIQLQKDARWWGIQQAVGPHYECTSLGAKDIVELIRTVPGWEKYPAKK